MVKKNYTGVLKRILRIQILLIYSNIFWFFYLTLSAFNQDAKSLWINRIYIIIICKKINEFEKLLFSIALHRLGLTPLENQVSVNVDNIKLKIEVEIALINLH